MNDLEINIALAKAMGWESDQLAISFDKTLYTADWPRKDNRKTVLQNRIFNPLHLMPWRKFDYRDPVIFVAICKHWALDVDYGIGVAGCHQDRRITALESGNIERAAAMVVIELFKRGVK